MDYAQNFESFISQCRRTGLSAHTIRAYQSDLEDFAKWLEKQALIDMDRTILESWLKELRMRGYAPSTIKRKLASLKVAFRWLEDRDEPPLYCRRLH